MGDVAIIKKGGGRLYAVIAVTYPAGSACTCTKGEKVLKAKDTSGRALFSVSIGTWVVSCTDGTDTASKEVSITAEGQAESVTLSYNQYYFYHGNEYTEITGGWTRSINRPSEATDEDLWAYRYNYDDGTSYAECVTNNGIDMTDITTVYVVFKGTPSLISFSVGSANITPKEGLNALDVSKLVGSHKIYFGGSGTKGTTIYGLVTECYGV